jgi:hypothetical protein
LAESVLWSVTLEVHIATQGSEDDESVD